MTKEVSMAITKNTVIFSVNSEKYKFPVDVVVIFKEAGYVIIVLDSGNNKALPEALMKKGGASFEYFSNLCNQQNDEVLFILPKLFQHQRLCGMFAAGRITSVTGSEVHGICHSSGFLDFLTLPVISGTLTVELLSDAISDFGWYCCSLLDEKPKNEIVQDKQKFLISVKLRCNFSEGRFHLDLRYTYLEQEFTMEPATLKNIQRHFISQLRTQVSSTYHSRSL